MINRIKELLPWNLVSELTLRPRSNAVGFFAGLMKISHENDGITFVFRRLDELL